MKTYIQDALLNSPKSLHVIDSEVFKGRWKYVKHFRLYISIPTRDVNTSKSAPTKFCLIVISKISHTLIKKKKKITHTRILFRGAFLDILKKKKMENGEFWKEEEENGKFWKEEKKDENGEFEEQGNAKSGSHKLLIIMKMTF